MKPGVAAAYASLAAGATSPPPRLGAANNAPAAAVPADPANGTTPYAQTVAGAGLIVDSPLGPPGLFDAVFTNDWYETTPNDIVEVYAGHLAADSTQGVVIVAIWDTTHATWLSGGRYATPAKIGAVTIVGANGELVLLTGAASTISFDPRSGAFR